MDCKTVHFLKNFLILDPLEKIENVLQSKQATQKNLVGLVSNPAVWR